MLNEGNSRDWVLNDGSGCGVLDGSVQFSDLGHTALFCINPIYCFGTSGAVWHVCCMQNCRPIHSSQTANPNCLQSGSESRLQQRTRPPPTKEIAGFKAPQLCGTQSALQPQFAPLAFASAFRYN